MDKKYKSPLKNADATLVQGAYNAAAAGIETGKYQGMDKLLQISSEAVSQISKNRAQNVKKGNDLADDINSMNGSMGQDFFGASEEYVKGLHGNYKSAAQFGRKNKQGEHMGELNKFAIETANAKEIRNEIAQIQTAGDWSEYCSDAERNMFNNVMDPKTKKRVNKEGKWEVDIGDGNFMLMSDIKTKMGEFKKDYKTMVNIRKDAIGIAAQAKEDALRNKEEGYTPKGFEPEKYKYKMLQQLKEGNMGSLMYDDVLENGEPFAKALEANPQINGLKYADLGLTPPPGDDNGIIDGEETAGLLGSEQKASIIDALINPKNEFYNEDTTRDLMADYFVGFIGNQYTEDYKREGGTPYNSLDKDDQDAKVNSYLNL